MATFGISMDGVPVRYTDDLPSDRQIRIRYALTFDEKHSDGKENPIAKFVVENGRIREVQSGFYIKHTWWSSFHAVLVPSEFSNTECCWEFIPTSSGKYFIRRIVTGLGWTYYLGSGDLSKPVGGNCPPSGLVMFSRVSQNVPTHHSCMQREWTIQADDPSQQDQIINSLPPITICAIDQDCEDYGTFGRVCQNSVCVDPDPIDCEWRWLEWGLCDPTTGVRHRGWVMDQPAKYGGACYAPQPGFFDQEPCQPQDQNDDDVEEVPDIPSGTEEVLGSSPHSPPSSGERLTSNPTGSANKIFWNFTNFDENFFNIWNGALYTYVIGIFILLILGSWFFSKRGSARDRSRTDGGSNSNAERKRRGYIRKVAETDKNRKLFAINREMGELNREKGLLRNEKKSEQSFFQKLFG